MYQACGPAKFARHQNGEHSGSDFAARALKWLVVAHLGRDCAAAKVGTRSQLNAEMTAGRQALSAPRGSTGVTTSGRAEVLGRTRYFFAVTAKVFSIFLRAWVSSGEANVEATP